MTRIYHNPLSPNAKRVAVTASELGLSPDLVELDMARGEHRSPEYLKLNPMGKVPTMVDDDGFVLWESYAVAWYLAERNPSKGLLPMDLKGRADQMRWMFWSACHVEPAVNTLATERWIKPVLMKQEGDEARCAEALKQLERYLPVLDARLEGRMWLGETCSLADVCLGVTLEVCGAVQADLSAWKNVTAWLGRLQARPSWKKASPAV